MNNCAIVTWSSVAKKIATGLTGMGLFGFVVAHLIGNLTYFMAPDGAAFNAYAEFLSTAGHGLLLTVFEIGLIGLFVVHIVYGVAVWVSKKSARPIPYARKGDAGGPSQKTFSSQTMIVTGLVLGAFTVWHVWQFRFGPNVAQGYVVPVHGESIRDLFRLVRETFANPLVTGAYVVCMVLLGFHLRHGFWSMFQSLGLNNERVMPLLRALALCFALVLAFGFLFLPIYIYFHGAAPAVSVAAPGGLR